MIWEKLSKPFEELLDEHVKEYKSFYGRTSLRLWDDVQKISNGNSRYDLRERLTAFHEGASDPELYAILFAFGKYLLISSSRPGTQAANLQGIWSNDIIPPWFGDFTVNINTEMNYWMTGPLNLAQMQEPLVNLCKALVKTDSKLPESCLTVREPPASTTRISGVKPLRQRERRYGRSGHLGRHGSAETCLTSIYLQKIKSI